MSARLSGPNAMATARIAREHAGTSIRSGEQLGRSTGVHGRGYVTSSRMAARQIDRGISGNTQLPREGVTLRLRDTAVITAIAAQASWPYDWA